MIVANWKCNGSKIMIQDWISKFKETYVTSNNSYIGIAPSYIYIEHLSNNLKANSLDITYGVQNIDLSSGARTSAISLEMVKDMSCNFSIIGHSEMRIIFGETNENISEKLDLIAKSLDIILCIGESAEENINNQTKEILKQQLEVINGRDLSESFTIAYEPVWAIGTGKTPTPNQINDIHKFIKDVVQSSSVNNIVPKVLYGGSVNENNAQSFFNEDYVDGALIGGASLNGNSFAKIVNIFNGVN
tara:strand:- start:26 stop:763 length:738 start_codon:yes stop_codon:yes gene_type:complete